MPRQTVIERIEAQEGQQMPDALIAALRAENGNVSAVARRFGVDRVTVYDWMRHYGIERRAVFTAV